MRCCVYGVCPPCVPYHTQQSINAYGNKLTRHMMHIYAPKGQGIGGGGRLVACNGTDQRVPVLVDPVVFWVLVGDGDGDEQGWGGVLGAWSDIHETLSHTHIYIHIQTDARKQVALEITYIETLAKGTSAVGPKYRACMYMLMGVLLHRII